MKEKYWDYYMNYAHANLYLKYFLELQELGICYFLNCEKQIYEMKN